jgi:hypothetical protein
MLLVVGIFLHPLVVYAGSAAMLGAAPWNAVALGRAFG